jgi:hypothetical protein
MAEVVQRGKGVDESGDKKRVSGLEEFLWGVLFGRMDILPRQ